MAGSDSGGAVIERGLLRVSSNCLVPVPSTGTVGALPARADVPVPASVLRPGSLAYDMMYGPAAQGFLDWAQAHGAVARDGLGMLVEQAAEAFAIWRGVRPPSAQVLEELRRAPH